MNHSKYRVLLISTVLAVAVLFGVIWYISGREEEKKITEGTLVWHMLPEQELYQDKEREEA